MRYTLSVFILFIFVWLLGGCKEKYAPKPTGFFRIDFPEKAYQTSQLSYPYAFEYPVYAHLIPDSSVLSEPFWLNIYSPANKVNIHLSYKKVTNNLFKLTEESRELAYKHAIKANAINENLFIDPDKKVFGTIYTIKGNVASTMQFHLTDSLNHFIRGSFYISEIPNFDSLKPVIQFYEQDIYHLIETFTWK
ncbi:MAG: gliding motility lipoprotein GldD [Prolixibacteraceae bacterium]|nr:gliding motility lipoprotein GldD [Prolixibacteraceae bacterium]